MTLVAIVGAWIVGQVDMGVPVLVVTLFARSEVRNQYVIVVDNVAGRIDDGCQGQGSVTSYMTGCTVNRTAWVAFAYPNSGHHLCAGTGMTGFAAVN